MKAAACALAGMMTLGPARAHAQEPAPDKSLDRMHSVLAHVPLRITLPDVEANFKVHIEAVHPMHDIFETVPWATEKVGWQPPSLGFDLLSVFRYMGKAAADAKREHDVRNARDEVQRAIDDYCAAQPNRNMLQLCTGSR
jgi:hypothetical protein